MVKLRYRHGRLRNIAQPAGPNDPVAGRVHRLVLILLGDLDFGSLPAELFMKLEQSLKRRGRRRLGQHRNAPLRQIQHITDSRVLADGKHDKVGFSRFQKLIDVPVCRDMPLPFESPAFFFVPDYHAVYCKPVGKRLSDS